MYLVMMQDKPTSGEVLTVRKELDKPGVLYEYDGESTLTIKNNLLKEGAECVVVTADSRFLRFVGKGQPFSLENVYVYRDNQLKTLQEKTLRILRPGHNLMKLFESGEFDTDKVFELRED